MDRPKGLILEKRRSLGRSFKARLYVRGTDLESRENLNPIP